VASGEDLDVYMQELLQREECGERATIEVGPHTAMLLVGAIQWAVRGGQLAEHGPGLFGQVLDQLRLIFIDEPAGTALIQLYEPPPPEQDRDQAETPPAGATVLEFGKPTRPA
jgi:hypothetical protein